MRRVINIEHFFLFHLINVIFWQVNSSDFIVFLRRRKVFVFWKKLFLSLYIYIYIYICVCVCVCMSMYMYRIYINTYLCMFLFRFLCLCMYIYICIYTNLLSTSIHGYQEKRKRNLPGTRDKIISNHRPKGKKKKYHRTKKRKGQLRHTN